MCLSVGVFSLGKKLTRQEDQKLFFNFVWPYGHLGTGQKCPDYQGVIVILYDKVSFRTSTKCIDYAGVLIFMYLAITGIYKFVHTSKCTILK